MYTLVQAGKESTHGTAVAATKVLLAKLPFKIDRVPVIPADDIGKRVKGYRSIIPGYLFQNTLSFERAYFEALPLIFSIGVKGGITATEHTPSEGDYVWPFLPALDNSDNAQDSLTLEFGDNIQAFEAEYVMAKTIKISGTVDQSGGDAPVKIDADIFGRQITKTPFTTLLTPPTVTELSSKLARLYVNDSWATVGTTEKANILRAFDITIDTGLYPTFNGSSDKFFGSHGQGDMGIVATLTIENGADAIALFDAIGTMKAFRLSIPGPAIGDGDPCMLNVDFSGTVMEPVPGSSMDQGTSLATIAIEGIYDVTGTKLFDVNVTAPTQAL